MVKQKEHSCLQPGDDVNAFFFLMKQVNDREQEIKVFTFPLLEISLKSFLLDA